MEKLESRSKAIFGSETISLKGIKQNLFPNSSDLEEERIRRLLFSNAERSSKPVAIFLGGGSGTGKKLFKTKLAELGFITKNFVSISSSDILINLDDWPKFTNTTVCAANILHERSSDLADIYFAEAVKKNYHLIYDGTMGNIANTVKRIQLLSNTTFEVKLVGVFSDITDAIVRSLEDFIRTNRWVPYEVIFNSHTGFSNNFPFFASKITQSHLYFFDESNFKLIVSNSTIYDWGNFTKFINFRSLNSKEYFNQFSQKVKESFQFYDSSCLSYKLDLPFVYIGFAVVGSSLICAVFILVLTFSLLFTFWTNFKSHDNEEEALLRAHEGTY